MGHHMITRSKKNRIYSVPNDEPMRIIRRNKRSNCWRKPDLPIEVITEILSWLPVENLMSCKCVCKQWNELTQDHSFIEKHLNRHYKLIKDRPFEDYEYEENGETFQRVQQIHGLTVEKGIVSNKYRIKNLKLRRVLDLPDPHERSVGRILMSFARRCGHYKVANVYDCEHETETNHGGFQVLTLGTEEKPSWRTLHTNIFRNFNRKKEHFWMVESDGIVYFVRTSQTGGDHFEVVSLDLENERLTSSLLPKSYFPEIDNIIVITCNNQLSLAEITADNELSLLSLQDYKKGKWAEKKTVIPLKFFKENPDIKMHLEPYLVRDRIQHSVVYFKGMIQGTFVTIAYCIDTEKIIGKVIPPKGKICVFRYSLITFKGMRPE